MGKILPPAVWVELYLVRRASAYGVSSSFGAFQSRTEVGISGGAGFIGSRPTAIDELACDRPIWDSLSPLQQKILEIQHAPTAELEISTRIVSKAELGEADQPLDVLDKPNTPCGYFMASRLRCMLPRQRGSARCHLPAHQGTGAPKLSQTREGDELEAIEQVDGQDVARVRRTRAGRPTLEKIAALCGVTVPAVRHAIKTAHDHIARRQADRDA